ncbi:hypothetical protein J5I95_06060 [Candidatus Poribacteria bacterium]|nr:hypothetical protein [Candidatus Poribacteria bacterium]
MDTHSNNYVKQICYTTERLKYLEVFSIPLSFLRLVFIVGIALSLFLPMGAEARPEFATELDKECSFCHLDPAGGGPRNRIGEIFEENYFEFPEDFDMEAVTEEAKEVVKQLTTSLDFQTAFIKTTHVDEEQNAIANCSSCHSSVDRFLLMQAEVTFNAQASEHVRLTLSNNVGTTMNAFATVDAIPKHLYVKVGQFRLPFAIKQKDHNILVREGYGLGSNKRDVGVELGGSAGKVFYNAAAFNAANATAKGGLGTLGAQLGPVRAGISGIFEKPGEDWERLIGAFLTASYAGLSIEGEFNFGNSGEITSFASDAIDSKGYYVGAKYRVLPQLTLSGRYGLFDPDRTVKGDASQRVTLSAQYNFMENGAISLFYWANLANADRGEDDTISEKGTLRQLQGTDQIILMSRFWF